MMKIFWENKEMKESILDIQAPCIRDNLVFLGIPERLKEGLEVSIMKDPKLSSLWTDCISTISGSVIWRSLLGFIKSISLLSLQDLNKVTNCISYSTMFFLLKKKQKKSCTPPAHAVSVVGVVVICHRIFTIAKF